jgi:hypothetical protein
MGMKHIIFDSETGEIKLQGRDQQRYTHDEIERAERKAKRGDAGAQALLDNSELPDPVGGVVDWPSLLHDCPECRAAMARGEKPVVMTGSEVEHAARIRGRVFGRRIRWRRLKRRACTR